MRRPTGVMLLQEGTTVTWDTPPPLSPWVECGFIALWIALIYAHWRLLRWFIGKHMNRPNWDRFCVLLPICSMSVGVALSWLAYATWGDHTAFGVVVSVCAAANPTALLGALLAGAVTEGNDVHPRLFAVLAVIMTWTLWYFEMLWAEHRIRATRPVRLDLGEPGTPQTDPASKQA